jgi:hypothetical protein
VSRSRRARAKARKRAAVAPGPSKTHAADEGRPSRFDKARHRARAVKIGTGAFAAASLGGWMGLARVTYAGHHKHATEPLAIPPPLYAVVRRNLLQAGIVAPATAPPDAATATS